MKRSMFTKLFAGFCSLNTGALLVMVPIGLSTAIRSWDSAIKCSDMILCYFDPFFCLESGWFLSFLLPSTRVWNELGAGNPQAAKLATRVVICMAMTEGSVVAFTMILLRNSWGHMYSDEAEVVTYIARMIPVLAISFFIDGMHSALSGKNLLHGWCQWHCHIISM